MKPIVLFTKIDQISGIAVAFQKSNLSRMVVSKDNEGNAIVTITHEIEQVTELMNFVKNLTLARVMYEIKN